MTFEGTTGMRGLTLTQPWASEVALGLWRVSEELEARIREQLP